MDLQVPKLHRTNGLDLYNSMTRKKLLEAWKSSKIFLDKAWSMMIELYFKALRERHLSWHKHPRLETLREPKLGEVVLIHRELTPRAHFPIARIIEIRPSLDGFLRSVKVLLPDGKILTRPISLLYPLEVQDNEKEDIEGNNPGKNIDPPTDEDKSGRKNNEEETQHSSGQNSDREEAEPLPGIQYENTGLGIQPTPGNDPEPKGPERRYPIRSNRKKMGLIFYIALLFMYIRVEIKFQL
uniref:DUF5641 domain-containing protein n=1 Tax=Acrobeloides nanus TaxID=290746 RepID=A0A914D2P6_9BILA